ncbi:HNH endonuclease [Caballeronia sordidicola]|uniref:HNH endonuclease n=1 Tax=Caballeronia sordidicola TaxID=196367 RepID=UPI00211B0FF6|nr:HNH endonuclease [Caballeronia sordidicola]
MSCPHCATTSTPVRTKPLTDKQKVRLANAGNAVRIDDLSGHAWAKIRIRIRTRDGYQCQSCKVAVTTGIVDHKIALVNGGSNDDSNLQLMCTECHRIKTATDLGHRVKTGVSDTGMPTNPGHHWNT